MFMSLSERIKDSMRHAGIGKQTELARMVGVKSATVNLWVNGTSSTMDGKTLMKLSKVLKVSPWWLIFGEGKRNPNFISEGIDQDRLASCITKIEEAVFWLTFDLTPDLKAKMICECYILGGKASPEDIKSIIHNTSDSA